MNLNERGTKDDLIAHLLEIKMSIIEGASDTLWMRGLSGETVCERIDSILLEMGVPANELESGYCLGGATGDDETVAISGF
jgi:hypothetical protein